MKRSRYETVCQQGYWALKGVDSRVLHRLKKGTSLVLKGGWIDPEGGRIGESCINWRREWVWAPKGVDWEVPHQCWGPTLMGQKSECLRRWWIFKFFIFFYIVIKINILFWFFFNFLKGNMNLFIFVKLISEQ